MKTSKGFAQIVYIIIIAALLAAVGYMALRPNNNTSTDSVNTKEVQKDGQQEGQKDNHLSLVEDYIYAAEFVDYNTGSRILQIEKDTGARSLFIERGGPPWLEIVSRSDQNNYLYAIAPTNPESDFPGVDIYRIDLENKKFVKLDLSNYYSAWGKIEFDTSRPLMASLPFGLDTPNDQILYLVDLDTQKGRVLHQLEGSEHFSAGYTGFGGAVCNYKLEIDPTSDTLTVGIYSSQQTECIDYEPVRELRFDI